MKAIVDPQLIVLPLYYFYRCYFIQKIKMDENMRGKEKVGRRF